MIVYVGQNLKFIIFNSLVLLFYVILCYFRFRVFICLLLCTFNAIYSQIRVLCVFLIALGFLLLKFTVHHTNY